METTLQDFKAFVSEIYNRNIAEETEHRNKFIQYSKKSEAKFYYLLKIAFAYAVLGFFSPILFLFAAMFLGFAYIYGKLMIFELEAIQESYKRQQEWIAAHEDLIK